MTGLGEPEPSVHITRILHQKDVFEVIEFFRCKNEVKNGHPQCAEAVPHCLRVPAGHSCQNWAPR